MALGRLEQKPRLTSRCLYCACRPEFPQQTTRPALIAVPVPVGDKVLPICEPLCFIPLLQGNIADPQSNLTTQCRPFHPTTKRPPVAAQPGPQQPTENENKKLLRGRLRAAFEKAAIAAASSRESVTCGDLPAHILHQEPSVKEWAEAGIVEVDKMSDEQLDVGWVYGMLELLKRLTIACDPMQQGQMDANARKDYLLVWTD